MSEDNLRQILGSMDIDWNEWEDFIAGQPVAIDEDGKKVFDELDVDDFIYSGERKLGGE